MLIMNILKTFLSQKFLRFLVTGGLSTIINYACFWGLYTLEVCSYIWASIFGYTVGLIFGYFLNKFWTFEAKSRHDLQEIIKYITVYIISLIISTGVLYLLVEYLGVDPKIGQVGAIMVSTILNFIGLKIFVFKD